MFLDIYIPINVDINQYIDINAQNILTEYNAQNKFTDRNVCYINKFIEIYILIT